MKVRNSPQKFVAILYTVAILATWLAVPARGQQSSPPTTHAIDKAEFHQALLDLTNPFTVMCVAAHPDDEDGTTLTVLRRKFGVHTVSLFTTYGEGGQNAVGPELYEELGVIRMQETVKAALIQGSEPYFLGLKDFGFSKSADEAFSVWGHDEALRRMVLKIRELRPDVIITNHDTTSGHGHHQATGRLILEAFDAAADPNRFPEQLKQLKPWQAQRLFVRIFGGGNAGTAGSSKTVAIDPNEVDPVRGTSFAAQALSALQQHATQGPWPKSMEDWLRARRITSGKLPPTRYQLVKEAANAQPLPQSAATMLDGLKPSVAIPSSVATIEGRPLTEFLDQPGRVRDSLIKWRVSNSADASVGDAHRLQLLDARFSKALALASGISLVLKSRDSVLIPGNKTTFTINLANSGDRAIEIKKLSVNSWGDQARVSTAEQLLAETDTSVAVERLSPKTAPFTLPKEDHLYDGLVFGQPFRADAELEIDGAGFQLSTTINLDVAPSVEIKNISPSPCVRTQETLGGCRTFNVELTNHLAAPFRGTMKISESRGARSLAREITHQIVLAPRETRTEIIRDIKTTPAREALGDLRKSGITNFAIQSLNSSDLVTQRAVKVIFSDARVARDLQVGYIPSFDQTIERSLSALGVEAKELSVADIQTGGLSVYHTIIIDNRGYEAHAELIAANSRLLEFVQAGGTLLVFYHKDNEWNPDPTKGRPQLAPYPIVLGGERVTDETAPIKFLQPRHPLLNFPNRIGAADFKDWIQERGLYYPKQWDPQYTALFSTNDPGEAPLNGGLLAARYGKGNYIYTSMVWYRQLRAGVPGAYRMFANMVSYGRPTSLFPRKNRTRKKIDRPFLAP
jgi:LmbE family N-acetylglucosaminyl deacetylase